MTDAGRPDDEPAGTGSVGRGVVLTAVAVALGAAILASIKFGGGSTPTSSLGTTPAPPTSSPPAGAGGASSTSTTTAAAHQPGSVKILVANGTSTKGVAGKLATKLTSAGYDVLSPTNTTSSAGASTIYYAAGYQGDAVAVAQAVGLSTSAVQSMGSASPSGSSSSGSSGSGSSSSGSSGSGSGSSGSSSSGSGSATSTSGAGGAAVPVSDTKGAEIVVVVGPDLASTLSSS